MKPADDRWKVASKSAVPQVVAKVALAPFRRMAQDWMNEAEGPTFGSHYDTSPNSWIGLALFKRALEGGPPVRYAGWDGNLSVPGAALLASVETALAVRLVMSRDGHSGNGTWTFSSDETMLSINVAEAGRYMSVSIATVSPEVVGRASQLFDRIIVPDNPEAGLVFSLAKSPMGGYQVRRLGAAGTPLERGNYNPKVLADFDHVVADLASPSPCGRLTILSGSPGTGKTYLVRSLLSQVKTAAFVVVPPHLIPELGSPEILPALTQAKSEFNGPIVLILEDADRVLVDRKQGDMSAISSMLNLGDGILGAVLDIRLLATTNAAQLEMDPATRRPGRLCRYTQVNPLEPVVAATTFQRLVGKPQVFQGPASLAEVYAKAREAGWVAPPIADPRPQMRKEIL